MTFKYSNEDENMDLNIDAKLEGLDNLEKRVSLMRELHHYMKENAGLAKVHHDLTQKALGHHQKITTELERQKAMGPDMVDCTCPKCQAHNPQAPVTSWVDPNKEPTDFINNHDAECSTCGEQHPLGSLSMNGECLNCAKRH